MTDTTMISNLELARQFFDHHELLFQRVTQAGAVSDRCFGYSADQFDNWAVSINLMPKAARDADGSVERTGLTQLRRRLRDRLNRAARAGKGVRAYSVEARGQRWRVVLGEAFLIEQPKAIVHGVRTYTTTAERLIAKTRKMIDEQQHLSDSERTQAIIDVSMAEFGMFNSLTMLELVARHIATGKRPNFRVLRQRLAQTLLKPTQR